MSIRVPLSGLPRELRARAKKTTVDAFLGGMNNAAREGQAILAHRTPRFTGATAARWRVRLGSAGHDRITATPEIENSAPHVGILELGARPHPVNQAGIDALTRWAQLKLGVSPDEAAEVAQRIAWKLRRHGQKPTYFIRDSLPDLRDAIARNVAREFERYAGQRAAGRR